MGRNDLKGLLANACGSFMGYRLHSDMKLLDEVKTGELELDLLSGDSTLNGKAVYPSLAIADHLKSWFSDQLKLIKVPATNVSSASLLVKFDGKEVPSYVHNGTQHYMTEFKFLCHARAMAYGKMYSVEREGTNELA